MTANDIRMMITKLMKTGIFDVVVMILALVLMIRQKLYLNFRIK